MAWSDVGTQYIVRSLKYHQSKASGEGNQAVVRFIMPQCKSNSLRCAWSVTKVSFSQEAASSQSSEPDITSNAPTSSPAPSADSGDPASPGETRRVSLRAGTLHKRASSIARSKAAQTAAVHWNEPGRLHYKHHRLDEGWSRKAKVPLQSLPQYFDSLVSSNILGSCSISRCLIPMATQLEDFQPRNFYSDKDLILTPLEPLGGRPHDLRAVPFQASGTNGIFSTAHPVLRAQFRCSTACCVPNEDLPTLPSKSEAPTGGQGARDQEGLSTKGQMASKRERKAAKKAAKKADKAKSGGLRNRNRTNSACDVQLEVSFLSYAVELAPTNCLWHNRSS